MYTILVRFQLFAIRQWATWYAIIYFVSTEYT